MCVCVMYCTVEQVVGVSRQCVYFYSATASIYGSASVDLCKKKKNTIVNGGETRAVIGHTNTPSMTMHDSTTHTHARKQVQLKLAYARKQTL